MNRLKELYLKSDLTEGEQLEKLKLQLEEEIKNNLKLPASSFVDYYLKKR